MGDKMREDYIEGFFSHPISDELASEIGIAIGYRKGNQLIFDKKHRCIGFICHKEDFKTSIKTRVKIK